MKNVLLSEANKLGLNVSNHWNYNDCIKVQNELNAFIPCHILVRYDENDNNSIYYIYIILTDYPFIQCIYNTRDKKYHFYIIQDNNSGTYGLTQNQINIKHLIEPNKIGVLNLKKITAWIKYLCAIEQIYKTESQKGNNIKTEFLKSIEGLPVKWYDNNKKGTIEMNGIVFSFEISELYVHKKIELSYKIDNTIENFKILSNNNLIISK